MTMHELTSDVDEVLDRHSSEWSAAAVIGDDEDPEVVYTAPLADPVGFVSRAELAAFFIGVEAEQNRREHDDGDPDGYSRKRVRSGDNGE